MEVWLVFVTRDSLYDTCPLVNAADKGHSV